MSKTNQISVGVISVIVSIILGGGIPRVGISILATKGGSGGLLAAWFLIAAFIGPVLSGILCIVIFFVGYFIVDRGKNAGEKILNQAVKYSLISILVSFLFMFIEPYLY